MHNRENHIPKYWYRFFLVSLINLVLAACAALKTPAEVSKTPKNSPDPDIPGLVTLSQKALQVAQKTAPDAMLRQVDTNQVWYSFRFSNAANNLEIDINVPAPDALPAGWAVQTNDVSPLLGQAKPRLLDLSALRAGPQRLAQALLTQWPGCSIRSLTLYNEEGQLAWVGFCDTPAGLASGDMDTLTGKFQPSGSLPARPPLTATPNP